MKILRIGTRGSDLALAQTKILQDTVSAAHPDLVTEVRVIHTQGDLRLDLPLGSASPLDKGAFTQELESALLRAEIDVAVHSLKDLPTDHPPGLTLAAILP
ncbi:MAG: hydroxymethylbilane synthase, partial [Verrucomicrobia bacterium]